jgi:hypothetical protein
MANTETWNGTNWTEVNDLNLARSKGASSGQSNTSALAFGGNPAPSALAVNEEWNGSSWTEVGDLNTGRREMGGAGTTPASLAFSGETATAQTAATEEWSGTSSTTKTISTD